MSSCAAGASPRSHTFTSHPCASPFVSSAPCRPLVRRGTDWEGMAGAQADLRKIRPVGAGGQLRSPPCTAAPLPLLPTLPPAASFPARRRA